ncbi:decarboxylase [Rivibacter subsaxonicus]|uniref:Arginine decarboxylase n=1 Tax=Rivibacter subsaxonicus TaxID=457575 RepID=A0A4Q7VNL8_9BURK|nr:decarboxylase [Rivibacter subsaxonicus]RZT97814.1 arginine decarboxylase [Rivibacter subsaxonicus]
MNASSKSAEPIQTLLQYYAGSEARVDEWRTLTRLARSLEASGGGGDLVEAQRVLRELQPIEELHAYPGPALLAHVNDRLHRGEWAAFQRLTNRISGALLTNSYREDVSAWALDDEAESALPDFAPPAQGHGQSRRPYFEVLHVAAIDKSQWGRLRATFNRLRRAEDEFVYEVVVVGSFEDAVLAAIFNHNLQAVLIGDGFPFTLGNDIPVLQKLLANHVPAEARQGDSGSALATVLKRLRPELDIFLTTDRDPASVAGSDAAAAVRRVFYGPEEPMEMHLSILDGIQDRYRTPYFDNLKHYAARPVGTFHALPIARGKSVFKSNWIRDMGEFYGTNLFLAESSATTGGLDSLLDPTGNIKDAQDLAARALGGDRSFFVTNGTSTANKIVHQAICVPGDIVLIDRDCHKSHHYGAVMCGAQPLYIDAFPIKKYSMYGSLGIRPIKEALLTLKAEGRLDKAKMLVLTNCTFDGHVANVERTMLEVLAIKPDMVFLWDEAWFGFARFSPFLRRRTAMGAVSALRRLLPSAAYREQYAKFKAEVGEIDPANKKLLDTRLWPDPDAVKLRVYETDSVHKSMSALRQGSIVVVADQEWKKVEGPFKEAFYAHTSTSPNLQIIASLDVARRQMELEGYELVGKATQLSVEIRREINRHPLISKYFHCATPAEMIPAEYRASGLEDFVAPGQSLADVVHALDTDEFFLDPSRITLLCGNAGFDGTQFKSILANEHDIQINKTSRNSVLVQININNTRSDMAHLIKALADISRGIDRRLADGGESAVKAHEARVRDLVEDVPDLPNFSHFHAAFRDNPKSKSCEGHMREAYYLAFDDANCEYLALNDPKVDERLKKGPELVSAKFVIPYPPGFPIMVPGQVISQEIITFMRKLDVKEIHGFNAARGLQLLRPDVLEAHSGSGSKGKRR